MNPFLFLLDVTTKITPSAPVADTTAPAPVQSVSFMDQLMQNPAMVVVVYCVILFAAMYFLSIRPNKKREQKMAAMRNAITVGDSVILNTGMFGRVVDVTAECFVIEFGTNKGVRIPVLKQEVFGKREPNLSNKVEEPPAPAPKKGLFSKKDADESSKENIK